MVFHRHSSMKNAYQILGVSPTATIVEIKDVYRKLSQEWHPDRNHSAGAGAMFAQISEAYRVLSDPAKRRELDERISKNLVENISVTVEHAVDAYLETLAKT